MPSAFVQGVFGASSLVMGAGVGILWHPRRALSAAIMAFGSGTLLSALAFEITLSVYQKSGFLSMVLGFFGGGGLFILATHYIDEKGGFIRNQSSSRRYLFEHRQQEISEVLNDIYQIEILRNLSPEDVQAIVPYLKAIWVNPDTVLCQEGEDGTTLFLIVEGEADVHRGGRVVARLRQGEVFGEMALLTAEPRSATVIARTPMKLYQLTQLDFEAVIARSPHLSAALSRVLARRLQETFRAQAASEPQLAQWRNQVLDSVELDLPKTEEQAILHDLAPSTAPLAILVGTLIDNLPESMVIGMTSGEPTLNSSFLLAVFISNFPEALSSSLGMKQAGTQASRILSLWLGVVLLSGLFAALGAVLGQTLPGMVVGLVQALSGGAILAMLASTMMPKAYELGGSQVAFSTILGFLTGFLISVGQG
jgi:CRP-like cAMP-binding protein